MARHFYPDHAVGDIALPTMITEVMPGPLAGAAGRGSNAEVQRVPAAERGAAQGIAGG